jgi:hypothetical protein
MLFKFNLPLKATCYFCFSIHKLNVYLRFCKVVVDIIIYIQRCGEFYAESFLSAKVVPKASCSRQRLLTAVHGETASPALCRAPPTNTHSTEKAKKRKKQGRPGPASARPLPRRRRPSVLRSPRQPHASDATTTTSSRLIPVSTAAREAG